MDSIVLIFGGLGVIFMILWSMQNKSLKDDEKMRGFFALHEGDDQSNDESSR